MHARGDPKASGYRRELIRRLELPQFRSFREPGLSREVDLSREPGLFRELGLVREVGLFREVRPSS